MKSDSMSKFDYLFLGSLIVDLFTVIAAWDWLVMDVHNQVWLGGGGPDMQVFMASMLPWMIAFGFGRSIALWTLISVFRIGFFRFVLAFFVALNAVSIAMELLASELPLAVLLAGVLSVAMTVAAAFFAFRPDAGAWLRREA